MTDTRNACSISAEKLEQKMSVGRPRHNWEDNIKMYFKEVE
jgi:hypothetical protein